MEHLVDPWEAFPEEHRDAVTGLSVLGQLEDTVHFCGHTFVLKTLRPNEKAAIAGAISPWQSTVSAVEVYNNAHVGMALVSVDGHEDFSPAAGPDLEAFARARLNYVTGPTGWWQPTLDFLYQKYLELELKSVRAVEALRDFYEGGKTPTPTSLLPSTDSVEDMTNRESSTPPTSRKSRLPFSISS